MNKKSKKAQRKEQIEQHEQQLPLYVSEGHWDEAMLENNSYYDVDIINKANAPIFRKIEEWEKKYANASSNMGKWYCQIRIDKLKAKLHHYESKP
jgi:hypothetical protein